MGLQQWLGDTPKSQFLTEQYLKLPYSGTCADATDCHLGAWTSWERIAAEVDADLMIVREGRRFEGNVAPGSDLRELVEQGYTILIRHAEQHDSSLRKLADEFRRDFEAPVNIHMYATPGGSFGFDWHYDAEDVFILQTSGQKEYSLRKNTVNPWPLAEAMPTDLKYEREIMPLMRCLLRAGDWLYIPNGYWHRADAVSESAAISLAVGVMSHAAICVWDCLRSELLDSLLWRQRLSFLQDGIMDEDDLRSTLIKVVHQLRNDVCRRMSDETMVDKLIEFVRNQDRPGRKDCAGA